MKPSKLIRIFIIALIAGLVVYYFLPEKSLPNDVTIDQIVVNKSKQKLMVYVNDELLKVYPVSLGFNPLGDKREEGDGKTPEGKYIINDKSPNSDYYLNLGISYPDKMDRKQARKLGKPPGGAIKIHGLPNGYGFIGKFHRWMDWTAGCIAVTNKEIEELYNCVSVGTEIRINK